MLTSAMLLAAPAAAIPMVSSDIRQQETGLFEFKDVADFKKSKHPNRHRKYYDGATNRRGRRGSSRR